MAVPKEDSVLGQNQLNGSLPNPEDMESFPSFLGWTHFCRNSCHSTVPLLPKFSHVPKGPVKGAVDGREHTERESGPIATSLIITPNAIAVA